MYSDVGAGTRVPLAPFTPLDASEIGAYKGEMADPGSPSDAADGNQVSPSCLHWGV